MMRDNTFNLKPVDGGGEEVVPNSIGNPIDLSPKPDYDEPML